MAGTFAHDAPPNWRAALDAFDYGDGGAFPDVPYHQFPSGLGKSRAPLGTFANLVAVLRGETDLPSAGISFSGTPGQAAAAGGAAAGSSSGAGNNNSSRLMLIQTAESQLTTKDFGVSELMRPDAAETEQERLRTKAALDAVVARQRAEADANSRAATSARQRVVQLETQTGQTRTVAIVDRAKDPLDPTRHKIQKIQQQAVIDTAPIIRSPTKKPTAGAGGMEADFKLPAAKSSWTNPKSKIISLEERERTDGRNYITRTLSTGHRDLSAALQAAERERVEEEAARIAAEQQRQEEARQAEEQRLADLALQAVRERHGGHSGSHHHSGHHHGHGHDGEGHTATTDTMTATSTHGRHPAESREERLARRQEEHELRDRMRDERQKQRRMEKTARQLGLTVEEISADENLRRQVLEAAPVDESGQLDPRLQYAKGAHRAGGTRDEAADEAGGSSASLYATESLFGNAGARSVATAGTFDPNAVRKEMELQAKLERERGDSGATAGVVLGNIDDDDEADERAARAGTGARTRTAAATGDSKAPGGRGFANIDDLL
jgi:SNW domain-containing protein 1